MLFLRLLAITSALFLRSCLDEPAHHFAETDLAGVWVSDGGAELRFDSRGHFWGVNLPADYYEICPQNTERCSGWGSWRIVPHGPDVEGLQLEFEHFPIASGAKVDITGNGPLRRIHFWDEHEPNYEFKKRDAPMPGPKEPETHLSSADLAGVWESDGGAQLWFEAQGRFQGIKIPKWIVGDAREKGRFGTGLGSWAIVYESPEELGAPEIELKFERGNDFPSPLAAPMLARGSGPSLRLYFGMPGEPELEFEKRGEPPPLNKEPG